MTRDQRTFSVLSAPPGSSWAAQHYLGRLLWFDTRLCPTCDRFSPPPEWQDNPGRWECPRCAGHADVMEGGMAGGMHLKMWLFVRAVRGLADGNLDGDTLEDRTQLQLSAARHVERRYRELELSTNPVTRLIVDQFEPGEQLEPA